MYITAKVRPKSFAKDLQKIVYNYIPFPIFIVCEYFVVEI